MRSARRALSPEEVLHASYGVCRLLITSPAFLRARNVAFYVATDGEVDPAPLSEYAHLLGKHCYLPVITDRITRFRHQPLAFVRHNPLLGPLVSNRYGIPEPAFNPRHRIKPEMLDIVLVPLVGFDRRGARLGMGKGFYDRTFAHRQRWFRRPKLVGLAYEFQELDQLETSDHDVYLDGIVTGSELIWVQSKSRTPGQRH